MDSEASCLPVFFLGLGPSTRRGEQLGLVTRDHVRHSLDLYQAVMPTLTGRSWSELIETAVPIIDAARRFDAELIHDLEGIALGAGVPFDNITVLCARSELLQLGKGPPIGECTTVVEPTRIGQTWDWFVRQLDACVVWHTPRFIAFAEGGMPPKIGVNADGVGVTLNFLSTSLPVDRSGLPVHVLLHHLLERATSTEDAVQRLLAAPSAGCAAIGLLDGSGHAAVVELAPHGNSAVLSHSSTTSASEIAAPLVQTNHCLSVSLAGLDTPGLLLDNSKARLARARQLIDDGVSIETLLADNDGGWHPIALSANPAWPLEAQLGTVAAVIADVHERRLLIAPGNPAEVGFTQSVTLDLTPA